MVEMVGLVFWRNEEEEEEEKKKREERKMMERRIRRVIKVFGDNSF